MLLEWRDLYLLSLGFGVFTDEVFTDDLYIILIGGGVKLKKWHRIFSLRKLLRKCHDLLILGGWH